MTPANGDQQAVRTTLVHLTDDELALLDGRCSEKVQAAVDGARSRIGAAMRLRHLTPMQAGFVADVMTEAVDTGRLRFYFDWITYCPLCKRSPGYVPYKSGPNRGLPNHKKPKRLRAVELADRFVTITNHVAVGGCWECVEPLLPDVIEALRGVPAELPDRLRADGEPVRKRHGHRHCKECGWRGHEGEMGKLRTLMGDGWYPGKCPSCGIENKPLAPTVIESVDGFTITEHPPTNPSQGAGS